MAWKCPVLVSASPKSHYSGYRYTKEITLFRNINGPELLILLVVILLLFGARKLPDLARSLGSSAKEFRAGLKEGAEEEEESGATSDV